MSVYELDITQTLKSSCFTCSAISFSSAKRKNRHSLRAAFKIAAVRHAEKLITRRDRSLVFLYFTVVATVANAGVMKRIAGVMKKNAGVMKMMKAVHEEDDVTSKVE
ncbi:hypothetical protein MRX96_007482 [Rhipicephalus microplus]